MGLTWTRTKAPADRVRGLVQVALQHTLHWSALEMPGIDKR